MLYEFYNEQELWKTDSKKKLEATFYVSGIVAGGVENGSKKDAPLKYTSTLCSALNLEQLKNQLDEIFSIHIYSVQLKESKETLDTAIKETLLLTNNDGKSGADFGPFKLQEAQISNKRKQAEAEGINIGPANPDTTNPSDRNKPSKTTPEPETTPRVENPTKRQKASAKSKQQSIKSFFHKK